MLLNRLIESIIKKVQFKILFNKQNIKVMKVMVVKGRVKIQITQIRCHDKSYLKVFFEKFSNFFLISGSFQVVKTIKEISTSVHVIVT